MVKMLPYYFLLLIKVDVKGGHYFKLNIFLMSSWRLETLEDHWLTWWVNWLGVDDTYICICYLPTRRSVFGKTVPKVLSSRPRAQFFAIRTDLGRQITCLFYFSLENYFIRNIFVDFLLQQFHTVRVHLTFWSSKPMLFI